MKKRILIIFIQIKNLNKNNNNNCRIVIKIVTENIKVLFLRNLFNKCKKMNKKNHL